MPMTSPGMKKTLADPALQLAVYTATGRLMDKRKGSIAADATFRTFRNFGHTRTR